ncbi:MAG: tRNA epoxyqueuosine(34) reductase QueG, partial [Methylophilaceae bacterium]|nr:tRNA epoxyqueuosine(34) reductase QueG [Methylophilaceae bacterium]
MNQSSQNLEALASSIKSWGKALGFSEVGIADTDLASAER